MRYFAPQPASLANACKYAAICTPNLPRNNQPLLVAFYTSYLKYLVDHKETTTSKFCVCYIPISMTRFHHFRKGMRFQKDYLNDSIGLVQQI